MINSENFQKPQFQLPLSGGIPPLPASAAPFVENWSRTTCDTPMRLWDRTTFGKDQPEVASRCCSRSWAASSISLCRHSEAR